LTRLAEEKQLNTGNGNPKEIRGKIMSYAFFVQTCLEGHKEKHMTLQSLVNFSEFSKKNSERWKTKSAKEKGKCEDTAKTGKVHDEREMKTCIPPQGEIKRRNSKIHPRGSCSLLVLLSVLPPNQRTSWPIHC
jgi:high mobility group protein B1